MRPRLCKLVVIMNTTGMNTPTPLPMHTQTHTPIHTHTHTHEHTQHSLMVVVRLRLCKLVVVMGKAQVLPPRVDVHAGAQHSTGHGTALNVPACRCTHTRLCCILYEYYFCVDVPACKCTHTRLCCILYEYNYCVNVPACRCTQTHDCIAFRTNAAV